MAASTAAVTPARQESRIVNATPAAMVKSAPSFHTRILAAVITSASRRRRGRRGGGYAADPPIRGRGAVPSSGAAGSCGLPFPCQGAPSPAGTAYPAWAAGSAGTAGSAGPGSQMGLSRYALACPGPRASSRAGGWAGGLSFLLILLVSGFIIQA